MTLWKLPGSVVGGSHDVYSKCSVCRPTDTNGIDQSHCGHCIAEASGTKRESERADRWD